MHSGAKMEKKRFEYIVVGHKSSYFVTTQRTTLLGCLNFLLITFLLNVEGSFSNK